MSGITVLCRHQHLALRKEDPTANVRIDCVDKVAMKNYFSILKDTLIKHGLLNSPSRL